MNARWTAIILGVGLFVVSVSWGQKGMGESVGLARQGAQPEMETLQGELERIETGPCRQTTGKAYIGTHLFLRTESDELINLHIGSAEAVAEMIDFFEVGQEFEVDAFRTDLHPSGHYVAKVLRSDGHEWVIRDDDLSPFWAAQRRGEGRELRRERRREPDQRREGREMRMQRRPRRSAD